MSWSSGVSGTVVALEVVSKLGLTMFVDGQGVVGGSTPILHKITPGGMSVLVGDEMEACEAGMSWLD
jgi:hypothetical protein